MSRVDSSRSTRCARFETRGPESDLLLTLRITPILSDLENNLDIDNDLKNDPDVE